MVEVLQMVTRQKYRVYICHAMIFVSLESDFYHFRAVLRCKLHKTANKTVGCQKKNCPQRPINIHCPVSEFCFTFGQTKQLQYCHAHFQAFR